MPGQSQFNLEEDDEEEEQDFNKPKSEWSHAEAGPPIPSPIIHYPIGDY